MESGCEQWNDRCDKGRPDREQIHRQGWSRASPDGGLLFVACDVVGNWDGLQQSIATFDSTSLKLNAITKTAYRFNNISASPSGAGLLLSVPSGGNIILLSLQNLTQMNTVTLGLTPHVVKGPSD
jgi:hypothetical protein